MLGRHLFSREGGTDESTTEKNQLAQMVALLGPVPEELLADSGPRALDFSMTTGRQKGRSPLRHLSWSSHCLWNKLIR